jgi:spore maturation protein CgeB
MKILVVGAQGHWTQAVAAEFHALGHEVVGVYDYRERARALRRFGVSQLGRWNMNAELVRACEALRPDVLFVNKGERLWGSALRRISRSGTKTVDWFPDDPHRIDLSMRLCRRYDVYLTHCSYAAKRLREERGANAHYMPLSCVPIFLRGIEFSDEELEHYRADVCFIGTHDSARERLLAGLTDFDLRVWGPDWAGTKVAGHWTGHGAYGLEAMKVLAGAKVVVNVHRNFGGPFERYGHGANVRTFETTAAGAFLVCDRKRDVEAIFEEDAEVAYYESVDEAREKVRHYLEHEDERRAAAARAREKTRREHSLRRRLEDILAIVSGDGGAASAQGTGA